MATDCMYKGDYLNAIGYTATAFVELCSFGMATELNSSTKFVSSASKTGITVLGHNPEYVELAERMGARRFQVPTNVWNKMSPVEQWSANKKFLDETILRGDKIRLATPLNQVKPGSFFEKELNYMFDNDFGVSSNGLWLVK